MSLFTYDYLGCSFIAEFFHLFLIEADKFLMTILENIIIVRINYQPTMQQQFETLLRPIIESRQNFVYCLRGYLFFAGLRLLL